MFGGELMSNWVAINTSGIQKQAPIAVVTMGALEDLGYVVDYSWANAFTLGLVY